MVCILLGTGFEEAEALVPADLLRRAGAKVALVGVNGPEVAGSHGITVKADLTLDQVDAGQVELLMLPGGMGGVNAMKASPAALALIQAVYDQGSWLTAICAAPTILGAMGLLQGRQAVCYPGLEDALTGAVVRKGCPVVVDGRLVTGEGPGSAFPFGLKLVELLKGPAALAQVLEEIHYHG